MHDANACHTHAVPPFCVGSNPYELEDKSPKLSAGNSGSARNLLYHAMHLPPVLSIIFFVLAELKHL